MGNICCGGAEEKKADAFGEASNDATDRQSLLSGGAGGDQHHHPSFQQQQQQQQQQQHSQDALSQQQQGLAEAASNSNAINNTTNNNIVSIISPAEQKAADERFKAAQEEQARLELIVQATGRGMVPVRSQRGSTAGYYQDQGFAAALAQHLEQTTQFPERLAVPLPPAYSCSSSKKKTNNGDTAADVDDGGVYACLAQPEWEGIALGNKDGENPVAYMDHIAEQCLDASIPKKERLFVNVPPIVENLL